MAIRVTSGSVRINRIYHPKGKVLTGLSKNEEARLISLGVAEMHEEIKDLNLSGIKKSDKLIPDGDIEKVKEYISEIEDVELLQKLAVEEECDMKRKTVLEAIEERILKLGQNDDTKDDDKTGDKNTLNIVLNTDDVIVDG